MQKDNLKNNLKVFLNKMWDDYCLINPHAKAVAQALESAGENIVNDHIALRTFSLPQINKDVLSQVFLKYGYKKAGEYRFEQKKLTAIHFEYEDLDMPKVFISQIELSELSEKAQKIISDAVNKSIEMNTQNENFVFSGRPWGASYAQYLELEKESEYAAWVYAHGFRPNHFTIYVNYLKKYNDIHRLNDFLKSKGFRLNQSGGEVKGTPEQLLEQSSTMAGDIEVNFIEDKKRIPACYYEFAKRYPEKNGKLYQGFIAASADKIFESTNRF